MKTSNYLTPVQIDLCKLYYYEVDEDLPFTKYDPNAALAKARKLPVPNDEKWEQLAEWIWLSPRFN